MRSREPATSDTRPVAFPGLDPGSQMRIGFQQFASCSKRGVDERREDFGPARIGLVARQRWADGAVCRGDVAGACRLCSPRRGAARRMSLQTQMQAAADSLALAGARELNKQPGAEARAQSAMANAYASTKSPNTLFGVVPSPTLTYTFAFYSSLAAASERDRGGRGVRGRRCEIPRRDGRAADFVHHPPSIIFGECFNRRVRRRRRSGGRLRWNGRLLGCAPLHLQSLRGERRLDDRRASDSGPEFGN